MKTLRRLFATLFLLCIAGMAIAQDVIVMKDRSTIMSKVLEITSTEIKYKKWNNQDGPTYSINCSEVVSINYENGEVESFSNLTNQPNTNQQPIQKTDGGYMDYTSSRLKLNGKILSDTEVKNLVDEHNYQIYLKGKRHNTISTICFPGALLASVGAGFCFGFEKIAPAIVLCLVSSASWIGFICFSGKEEMEQVATEYNRRQSNYYSFNISPSIMNYETPQSQHNHGLGITFSLNF